ncbi:unnamed protein product [Paramecium primaurelia]|uniref:Arrestin-like N-terminal domain-containing protein n=1 Tax=Paramecium primaurelia TaxID=5886 RepID=A0A8S1LZX0_PARPR|nr:unnamed protein product [Paramecium primaurelia]
MGNQNFKEFDFSNQTGLYIRTDKLSYNPGEEVKGNIYLNLVNDEQLEPTIYLKVKGYEKAKWKETRTIQQNIPQTQLLQNQSREATEFYDNENVFYQHKIQVYQFQSKMIPQGQYQFPFEFQLKQNLPASFEYKEQNLECRIKYSVKAEIDSPNNDQKKIKFKQEFLVREPNNDKPKDKEQTLYPKTCFCIPMGTIQLDYEFDQEDYQSNDIANLTVKINNSQSKVGISTITGNLKNTLKLVSKTGQTKLISRTCGTSSIPGIQAGQNNQNNIMTLKFQDQGTNIPLNPTTNGKIIMSNYQFSVSAELKGIFLCFAETESKDLQIRIQGQQIQSYDQFVAPTFGWNPQVMETFSIYFQDSNKYYPQDLIPEQNQNTETIRIQISH